MSCLFGFEDYQVMVFLRTLWKGCRFYFQLRALFSGGLEYVIFEKWEYGRRRFLFREKIVVRKPLLYLSGYRYDYNRGRHFDRKRKHK
ncbi:MAG: hypothetical protein GWN94_10555 [Phycisphaerae bacterium]|nr:hypothetical protein [Phycisphaerae bacterium]NIS51531.1 hypothetical protein [Phycisphaerae bacterium]